MCSSIYPLIIHSCIHPSIWCQDPLIPVFVGIPLGDMLCAGHRSYSDEIPSSVLKELIVRRGRRAWALGALEVPEAGLFSPSPLLGRALVSQHWAFMMEVMFTKPFASTWHTSCHTKCHPPPHTHFVEQIAKWHRAKLSWEGKPLSCSELTLPGSGLSILSLKKPLHLRTLSSAQSQRRGQTLLSQT